MCGHLGVISYEKISPDKWLSACKAQYHRGPDDSGEWEGRIEQLNIALRRVRFIPVLNYLDYDRNAAKKELESGYGWRDYGRKHGESTFTRFFQEYYLPVKFGIDKRRAHFSCQILAGHKSREDALEEMTKPLWAPGELEPAIDFACRKLGFSASEWNTIMKAAPLPHSHYPTDWAFQKNSHPMYQYFRRMATGRNRS